MRAAWGVVAAVVIVFLALTLYSKNNMKFAPAPAAKKVTSVEYGKAYQARTELCTTPDGQIVRDWRFADRWMMNQLSVDTYMVDGRVYNAFRIITDDSTLPRGHVRFRKIVINIGDGPELEGHSYLNTRVNGARVKIEKELLFVEFNGRLESQRRPLPACGTPRS